MVAPMLRIAATMIETSLEAGTLATVSGIEAEKGSVIQIHCADRNFFARLYNNLPAVCQLVAEIVGVDWLELYAPGKSVPLSFPMPETAEIQLEQPALLVEDMPTPRSQYSIAPELLALIPSANALNLSLFVLAYDGTYLAYYPRAGAKPIVPVEQMIGFKAMDFLPPEMQAIVCPNWEKAITSGQPVEYEYVYIRDGEWTRSRTVVVPYPDCQQAACYIERLEVKSASGNQRHQ